MNIDLSPEQVIEVLALINFSKDFISEQEELKYEKIKARLVRCVFEDEDAKSLLRYKNEADFLRQTRKPRRVIDYSQNGIKQKGKSA